MGGIIGFAVNSRRRDRAALFVFIPSLLVFADSWYELNRGWNVWWSKQTRHEYVMNNLFGPACAETECLYTLGTATLPMSVLYSIGAYVALVARRQAQDR